MLDFSNNNAGALVTLAAQAAGTVSQDVDNPSSRGILVGINISAVTGSPSLTVTVRGKDYPSGQYYTLLASAAITGTGFTLLTIYPGVTAAANSAANLPLPRTFNIEAVVTGAASTITGTISGCLLL